jgi:uncharacterized protein (TIGR02145 family)
MKHQSTLFAIVLSGSLLAQSEYCGIGTVWDAESQTCIASENLELLDSNLDGVVGVADLLNLLSHFGDEDMDFDGIYDSVDDCIGFLDECGACNGPGPSVMVIDTIYSVYDSIFIEAINEWYVYLLYTDTISQLQCEVIGCTDELAVNFNPLANVAQSDSCSYDSNYYCSFLDSLTYHGVTYGVVPINNQCWFSDNLQTAVYRNGDSIPGNLNDTEWASMSSGAQAVHPELDISEHGRLYNWYAVDDNRGLCPTGWHVPSDDEWKALESFLGLNETELNSIGWRGNNQGDALKSSTSDVPPWDGNNQYGLSLTQSYWRRANGVFYNNPVGTYQTSSSISSDCWFRSFSLDIGMIYRNRDTYYPSKGQGYSVRCVKD